MNSYSDYYGTATPGRRSRMQDNFVIGDAIGSMVAATVFGLTRAMDELDSPQGRAAATVEESQAFQRRRSTR